LPVIDRYLDAMVKHRAEAIVFKSGAVINLVVGGAPKPISSRPATEEQITTVLSEALGASYTPGLAGNRTFPYDGPAGSVAIQVENGEEGLVVRIQPATTRMARPANGGPANANAAPAARAPAPPPERTPAPVAAPPPRVAVTSGAPSHIDELFIQMIEMKASDLHLKSSCGPQVRVDGSMMAVPGRPVLTSDQLESLVDAIWPDRNRQEFKECNDTDFAYSLPGRARMRCNVFRDIAGVGAVFRQIPSKILTAEQLNLPKAVMGMCELDKGLVVVTGPTGSGKSTTLAAMVDWINANRDDHLITIEDPVEFVHADKKCLINQREVGTQTKSFKAALRAALREDPDIVLVGEMRDLETVAIAIETAETGHLVFGTLHTNTAPSTVDRLIDQFPTDRQSQVRVMLSESLKGVVAQTLLKKKGGGRVAALEILIVTPAVANLIREGKTFQIPSLMQTGRGLGMQTLMDSLFELVKSGVVEAEEAYARAPHKKEFAAMLTKNGHRGPWSDEKAAP
jgi:twitching motility protein PilT